MFLSFCLLYRHLHWSSLTNAEQSTQLYQFQINPLQPSVAAATDIEIGTFSLESFTVDVVNNCLVLTDGKGVLQYVSNGSIGNKCPGRATDGTFGERKLTLNYTK